MPLQKLQFRPGLNRESTTLANEGGWFDADKIRFRSGFPEKIGGWVKDTGSEYGTVPTGTFVAGGTSTQAAPPSGQFWGVCRSIFNWISLSGYNLVSLGTNLKYYIQNSINGTLYDATPITSTLVVASNAFTTTYPANATTVTCNTGTAHNAQAGDFVTISGVGTAINGIPAASLNREFQIVAITGTASFTIVVNSGATSAGTTGAATFNMELTSGNAIYSVAQGWGAGGWGGVTTGFASTGWGQAAATGVGVNLRLWSQSNFGENLIFNARGGAMNFWAVDSDPTIFDRGQVIVAGGSITQKNYATGSGTTSVSIDATCPSQVNQVMVSDASRFTIAFGCNDPTGVVSGTALDPLLVRWSDQESYSTWLPAVTNQAGSYRLSQGSQIITAIQTRQEILILTDAAIYSMQFLGAPYVWGFQLMGSNISVMGPNSAITVNNITYWMGNDKFYMYSGRVETLPCSLRQFIFDNINQTQAYQVCAGLNEGYNEIWWFYCSASSNQIDRYVIFNYLENTWYYGTMNRTAWYDGRLRQWPMGTNYDSVNQVGSLIYHENGVDDGTTNPASPIVSYVQSSDFDIGDGHNFGFVWRLIPDVTFDGSNSAAPSVNFTTLPRQNPGSNYGNTDNPAVTSVNNYTGQQTYLIQQFTQYAYVRCRGRQMAFKVGSSTLGTQWQLGVPRIDIRPDGRK